MNFLTKDKYDQQRWESYLKEHIANTDRSFTTDCSQTVDIAIDKCCSALSDDQSCVLFRFAIRNYDKGEPLGTISISMWQLS